MCVLVPPFSSTSSQTAFSVSQHPPATVNSFPLTVQRTFFVLEDGNAAPSPNTAPTLCLQDSMFFPSLSKWCFLREDLLDFLSESRFPASGILGTILYLYTKTLYAMRQAFIWKKCDLTNCHNATKIWYHKM